MKSELTCSLSLLFAPFQCRQVPLQRSILPAAVSLDVHGVDGELETVEPSHTHAHADDAGVVLVALFDAVLGLLGVADASLDGPRAAVDQSLQLEDTFLPPEGGARAGELYQERKSAGDVADARKAFLWRRFARSESRHCSIGMK